MNQFLFRHKQFSIRLNASGDDIISSNESHAISRLNNFDINLAKCELLQLEIMIQN